MKFVRCTDAERGAVENLYLAAVRELLAGTNYPQWSEEYPAWAVEDAVRRGEQYAAVDGEGRMAGVVMLTEDPGADYSLGSWKQALETGEFLTVHALAAAPEAKGRGVGRFLVENAIAAARSRGLRAVRLDIVPENLPARRLYVGCGFTPAGKVDLGRGLPQVPLWELFEYNL